MFNYLFDSDRGEIYIILFCVFVILFILFICLGGPGCAIEYKNSKFRILYLLFIPYVTIDISDILEVRKFDWDVYLSNPFNIVINQGPLGKWLMIRKKSGHLEWVYIICYHRDQIYKQISEDLEKRNMHSE
jgi:hypothetical protein